MQIYPVQGPPSRHAHFVYLSDRNEVMRPYRLGRTSRIPLYQITISLWQKKRKVRGQLGKGYKIAST